MSHRTALVTGVTGFLGSHLARELLAHGHKVVAFVRARRNAPAPRRRALDALDAVADLGADAAARLVVIEADVTEGAPALLRRLGALAAGIDEVWHCAVVFKFQERDRAEVVAHNVEGTRNLLDVALATGGDRRPRFFYVSTAFVCGEWSGVVPEALHEGQRFHNLYEWSKSEAERLVLHHRDAHGLDAVVLRPSIIVGDSRTGAAGANDTGYYGVAMALHRLRNSLDANLGGRRNGRDLHLRIEGRATTELNFVPVDFVVRAMTLLGGAPLHGDRIFHIANETPPTVGLALDCVAMDLGVTGLRLVNAQDFEETPMTAFERLVRRMIEFQAPYMRTEPRFSTAALRRVVPETSLPPPRCDAELLHRLNRWFFERLDRELAAPPRVAGCAGEAR